MTDINIVKYLLLLLLLLTFITLKEFSPPSRSALPCYRDYRSPHPRAPTFLRSPSTVSIYSFPGRPRGLFLHVGTHSSTALTVSSDHATRPLRYAFDPYKTSDCRSKTLLAVHGELFFSAQLSFRHHRQEHKSSSVYYSPLKRSRSDFSTAQPRFASTGQHGSRYRRTRYLFSSRSVLISLDANAARSTYPSFRSISTSQTQNYTYTYII